MSFLNEDMQYWVDKKIAKAKYRLKRIFVFPVQRAKRGYSDQDLWNFDRYIADMFATAIPQLKKIQHGHPEYTSQEDWYRILDEMSYGFEQYGVEYEHDRDDKEMAAWEAALEEALRSGSLEILNTNPLPSNYLEGCLAFEEKQWKLTQESLRLLSKHFMYLND